MTFKRGRLPKLSESMRKKSRSQLKPVHGIFPSQELSEADGRAQQRDLHTAAITLCSLSQWNEGRLAFPPGGNTRTKRKLISSDYKSH
jgi:hypothetical protein